MCNLVSKFNFITHNIYYQLAFLQVVSKGETKVFDWKVPDKNNAGEVMAVKLHGDKPKKASVNDEPYIMFPGAGMLL